MKIIAFFNLNNRNNLKGFNEWVVNEQTRVFKKYLKKMKNFKILKLVDSDNYPATPDIIQVFDWDGSADEWRKTLENFRSNENEQLNRISLKWMEFCDNSSTQILYGEEIETESRGQTEWDE